MMNTKNTKVKISRDELSEMFYQPTTISFFIVSFIFAKITWTINARIQDKMKQCYKFLKKLKYISTTETENMVPKDQQIPDIEEQPYLKYIIQAL